MKVVDTLYLKMKVGQVTLQGSSITFSDQTTINIRVIKLRISLHFLWIL